MRLDNQALLEEFHKEILQDYPDMSFDDLKDICFAPWRFLKNEMESGDLTTVKMMYFGTFQVNLGRAKGMLRDNEIAFKAGKLNKESYERINKMLLKYIEENEKT